MTPRRPTSGMRPAGPGPRPIPRIIPAKPGGMPAKKGLPDMRVSPEISQILGGPSQMPAQRTLNRQKQRVEKWPYTHVFPPPQAVRVEPEGELAAPAVGVQTVVLQYQVPDGFQFAFTGLIAVYTGSGFVLGSQDITWVLDVNTPIATPAGGAGQGYPIQGMSPSFLPKGGLSPGPSGIFSIFAPWPIPMPEILGPLDILRSKVTTTAAITPGAPNFFVTVFLGWMWESTL